MYTYMNIPYNPYDMAHTHLHTYTYHTYHTIYAHVMLPNA